MIKPLRMQFLRIILLENSPEELLAISRRCISLDQASSGKREIEIKGLGGAETINSGRGVGVGDDAFTALS